MIREVQSIAVSSVPAATAKLYALLHEKSISFMSVVAYERFERRPHKVYKVTRRYQREDYVMDALISLHRSVAAISAHLGLRGEDETDANDSR